MIIAAQDLSNAPLATVLTVLTALEGSTVSALDVRLRERDMALVATLKDRLTEIRFIKAQVACVAAAASQNAGIRVTEFGTVEVLED